MSLERALGGLTAVVVGAVTALAFAQSFHALRSFAEAQQIVPAGWGWMFAATIDGFVLAALLTSLSLSLQGDRGTAPWAVRLLAMTAATISLVFNLQHVPAGMARWGAAVPPVAVLAGLEVLLLQVRRAANRQGADAPLLPATVQAHGMDPRPHAAAIQPPDTTALPDPATPEGTEPDSPEASAETRKAPTTATPALPLDVPEIPSAEAAARRQARQLYDQQTAAGQRMTGAALGRAIGRSERYGRLLLAEFRAQDERSDRRDRDGAAHDKQVGLMPR